MMGLLCILTDPTWDPNDLAADGGVTAFDVVRKELTAELLSITADCPSDLHGMNERYINDLKRTAQAPHPCPFDEELYPDNIRICKCCENCTNQCARDI
jgi:hypothetical protein